MTALEPTAAFDNNDMDAIYLRGLAHMQLKELPQAEAEFHKIIRRPQISPSSIQRPLARLELARALAQEGNKPGAAEAYTTFLGARTQADAGQPLPATARAELVALQK